MGSESARHMFPIVLDLNVLRVGLVGQGRAALRRLALLDEDGAAHVQVFTPHGDADLGDKAGERLIRRLPTRDEIAGLHVLFLAGLSDAENISLAAQAREEGVLLNTEDVKELCDFHMPASVRRGDLLLSVSTGGASPGLARRLKTTLSGQFGPEWEARVEEISDQRKRWREAGMDLPTVSKRTDDFINEKGWLP